MYRMQTEQTTARYGDGELRWFNTLGWARRHARKRSQLSGLPFVIFASPKIGYAVLRSASVGRYNLTGCTEVEEGRAV